MPMSPLLRLTLKGKLQKGPEKKQQKVLISRVEVVVNRCFQSSGPLLDCSLLESLDESTNAEIEKAKEKMGEEKFQRIKRKLERQSETRRHRAGGVFGICIVLTEFFWNLFRSIFDRWFESETPTEPVKSFPSFYEVSSSSLLESDGRTIAGSLERRNRTRLLKQGAKASSCPYCWRPIDFQFMEKSSFFQFLNVCLEEEEKPGRKGWQIRKTAPLRRKGEVGKKDGNDGKDKPGRGEDWKDVRPSLKKREDREAFVAMIYGSSPNYFLCALTLGFCLKSEEYGNTSRKVVLLHTPDVKPEFLVILRNVYDEVKQVEYIRDLPERLYRSSTSRFREVFTKLRVWELVDFEKLVLMDLDVLVRAPVDALFDVPAPAALVRGAPRGEMGFVHGEPVDGKYFFEGGRQARGINCGVLVLEPSLRVFQEMMRVVMNQDDPSHYPVYGPEQDFLARFFAAPRWTRRRKATPEESEFVGEKAGEASECEIVTSRWKHLSCRYNFQVHLECFGGLEWHSLNKFSFPEVEVFHFSGNLLKPWEYILDLWICHDFSKEDIEDFLEEMTRRSGKGWEETYSNRWKERFVQGGDPAGENQEAKGKKSGKSRFEASWPPPESSVSSLCPGFALEKPAEAAKIQAEILQGVLSESKQCLESLEFGPRPEDDQCSQPSHPTSSSTSPFTISSSSFTLLPPSLQQSYLSVHLRPSYFGSDCLLSRLVHPTWQDKDSSSMQEWIRAFFKALEAVETETKGSLKELLTKLELEKRQSDPLYQLKA